jgi:hypothetical protein
MPLKWLVNAYAYAYAPHRLLGQPDPSRAHALTGEDPTGNTVANAGHPFARS